MGRPQPPSVLGDHDVVRTIAKSAAWAAVYEVVNRKTGAHAAAKMILDPANALARSRFRREAELLARCEATPGSSTSTRTGKRRTGVPT